MAQRILDGLERYKLSLGLVKFLDHQTLPSGERGVSRGAKPLGLSKAKKTNFLKIDESCDKTRYHHRLVIDILYRAAFVKFIKSSLKDIIKKQQKYFFLFVFSLISISAFGYNIRNSYPLTLFFILICSLKFSRQLYVVKITLLTIIAALYFPIGGIFGPPNYNAFIAAAYTNPQETLGFLSNIPIMYYMGSVLIILLGVICAHFQKNFSLSKKFSVFMIMFVLITIAYKPLEKFIRYNRFDAEEIGFTPIRFLRETYETIVSVIKDHQVVKQSLSTKDNWEIISSSPKYKNYILVIGESVRKDLMHNYGFSIKNTPFASSTNGIFFENYLSAGSSTVPSLTNTLAKRHEHKPQLHNNLINLAKKSGFYTYWVSNQHYLGEWDTPISIIAKQADSNLFLKVIDPVKFNDVTDEALLPFIKQCLTDKSTRKNKLIVVHLIGSHPPCCQRSNGKFDIYFHSKEVSCYIQSIRNTDKLLQAITEAAKKTDTSWSMMYFSDHGLALENDKFCHQEKYQEIFRVPMFIVSSDSDKKEQITAYRSAFNFPYLFSQWTGIQEKSLKTPLDYLSNEEYEEQSYVVLSDRGKTDIRLLPKNIIE